MKLLTRLAVGAYLLLFFGFLLPGDTLLPYPKLGLNVVQNIPEFWCLNRGGTVCVIP